MLIKCTFNPPIRDSRIQIIKEVRRLCECGLKDAKDFCDKHFFIYDDVDHRWYPTHKEMTIFLTPEQFCRYELATEEWQELLMAQGMRKIIIEETDKIFFPFQ